MSMAVYEAASAAASAPNVFADRLHALLYRPRPSALPPQSFAIAGLSGGLSGGQAARSDPSTAVSDRLSREIVFLWSIRVALSEIPDRLGRGQTAKEIDQLDNVEKYLERIGQINAGLRSISIDLYEDNPSKDQCVITLRQPDVAGTAWTEPLRLQADPSIVALARNDFGRSVLLDHLTGQRARSISEIPVWADPVVYVGVPSRRSLTLGAYASGRAAEDMLHVRPCGDHTWIRDNATGCAAAFHAVKQTIGQPCLLRMAPSESAAVSDANRAIHHWWEGQLHHLQADGMRGDDEMSDGERDGQRELLRG